MWCCLRPAVVFTSICLLFTGCSSESENNGGNKKPPRTDQVIKVSSSKLDALMGDLSPPLGQDGILIATPKDWDWLRRQKNYIIRYYRFEKDGFPRILISSESPTVDGIGELTEDNVKDFTKQIDAQLKDAGRSLLEPPIPMVLGNRPCARYVIAGKSKGIMLERQVLQTVIKGRMYTIELQVLEGEILEHRDYAYAAVASMRLDAPQDEPEKPEPKPDKKAAP